MSPIQSDLEQQEPHGTSVAKPFRARKTIQKNRRQAPYDHGGSDGDDDDAEDEAHGAAAPAPLVRRRCRVKQPPADAAPASAFQAAQAPSQH